MMSNNRPLMSVNEDSEILFRLGILTSKAKSKKRFEDTRCNSDNGTLSSTITDDEDSELDVLYDKRTLLNRESRKSGIKQKHSFSVQKTVPSISFFILGLLSMVVLATVPELTANANKTSNASSASLPLLFLVAINGFGCIIGNCLTNRLFKRCNPLFLLIFGTLSAVPSTLVIAWCAKLYSTYFCSFVLGILLGFIHEGGLIIVAVNGLGVRTILVLHILIGGGSMVAPLICLLFVNEPNQLPMTVEQFSAATLRPQHISENSKRELLQQSVPRTEFFSASLASDGKESRPFRFRSITSLPNNYTIRNFTSNRQFGNSLLSLENSKIVHSYPHAVLKRFSKNEEGVKRANLLWYAWKGKVSSLTGLKLAYAFVAILSFSCVIFFMLPLYFCAGDSLFTTEDEQKCFGRLSVTQTRYCWQWLAAILFFILSGMEGIFSIVVAVCAPYLFNADNHRQMAYFAIFAFWAGGTISRFTFSGSSKIASSMQLMQFLLLITSVISCFGALFSQNSSIVTSDVEVFLIGVFLSPVIPCVVGWLEAQKANSWWALCRQHCIAVSSGRTLLTVLSIILFPGKSSRSAVAAASFRYLFVTIAFLSMGAFLVLLLLTRYVRNVARVIAVEKLSETLMRADADDVTTGNTINRGMKSTAGQMPQPHNNGYVQLTSQNDLDSEDLFTGSDQEYENEL